MSRRSAVTVESVLSGLSPAQRRRVLDANPHLVEAKVAKARPRKRAEVTVDARREGDRVVVVCKGLRLVSEANAREHWTASASRAAAQRATVVVALARVAPVPVPCVVTIHRTGPGLLDTDNLQGAAKHVRDAVAQHLGVDDGACAPVTWVVTQERSRGYAVRIVIAPGGGA